MKRSQNTKNTTLQNGKKLHSLRYKCFITVSLLQKCDLMYHIWFIHIQKGYRLSSLSLVPLSTSHVSSAHVPQCSYTESQS